MSMEKLYKDLSKDLPGVEDIAEAVESRLMLIVSAGMLVGFAYAALTYGKPLLVALNAIKIALS